jgi:hypothetical protein
MMIDPKAKLVDVLGNAQEYLDLATKSTDRGERELYERIVALYLKIARPPQRLMIADLAPIDHDPHRLAVRSTTMRLRGAVNPGD